MSHHNLVLTEKAIKNHSKRLQKEMLLSNIDLSLVEAQNLFSRILGFNNYYELKSTLNIGDTLESQKEISLPQNDFYNFVLNNKNMDANKKQKFFENIHHFVVNKESSDFSELKKKKQYYEDLEKTISSYEYNVIYAILDYLDSCIKEDNLQEFVRKYEALNIEKNYGCIYDAVFDANASKIARYILNLKNHKEAEFRAQRALGAFAYHDNLEMVKYILNYPDTEVDAEVIMFSSCRDNNSTLKYLIDNYQQSYRDKHPREKDFTNFIKDGIIVSCQKNALNNFKLIMSLPNNIESEFIIKALVPSPLYSTSDEENKKYYDKKITIGKRFLEYLINDLNFEANQETKDLFGIN